MSRSGTVARWIAWGLCLVAVLLTAVQGWIDSTLLSVDVPYHTAGDIRFDIVGLALLLVNSVVGALIVWRQPRNAVGWLFVLYPVLTALGNLANSYAVFGTYLAPERFVATGPIYRISQILSTLTFDTVPYLMLLFPDGRFIDARWRRIGWALAPTVLFTFLLLIEPSTDDPNMGPAIALPGWEGVIGALAVVQVPFGIAAFVLGLWSVVLRYRRSHGIERLQIKWMVFASAIVLASVPTLLVSFLPFLFALQLLPIAAGIAILRHRLYDIDLLINRTLVYGATTAAIAVTFWLGILALQGVLSSVTSGSELAIAASTLVSLALFQPIRRRVQNAVDRRFDRSRYDAARTVDGFAERLRDEVDLDQVRADLIGSVQQTMAPAHTSLWLREATR